MNDRKNAAWRLRHGFDSIQKQEWTTPEIRDLFRHFERIDAIALFGLTK